MRRNFIVTVSIAVVATLFYSLWVGAIGQIVARLLPANWYFKLLKLKHGDPQSGNRIVIPWSRLQRACVILVVGQSNAANEGERRLESRRNNAGYLHDDMVTQALDPLPGCTGIQGSVWPVVADKLIDSDIAESVIIAGCAVGGSSVKDWAPSGKYHCILQDRISEIRRVGLEPTYVVWHQGETDTSLRTSERQYFVELRRLIESLRNVGVNCPFFVAMASYVRGEMSCDVIRAQAQAASLPEVFVGPDTDALGDEFRRDGLHWNYAGQLRVAELWAEVLLKYSYVRDLSR
jgi:hypothetical protein